MKNKYYFGKALLKEFDFFSFPRTGSHFFFYCVSGLFDLVTYPHDHLENEEAVSRQREINPLVLYSLELREDGIPYQPVCFNSLSNEMHGKVKFRGNKFVVLIREPVSVVYSLYLVSTSRWGKKINDLSEWVQHKFGEYNEFYTVAFKEIENHPQFSLLIRYEDLLKSSDALKNIVEFAGLKPKLSPEYVYSLTEFETFVKKTQRTFYQKGNNESWRNDESWSFVLDIAKQYEFERFGYVL